MNSSGACRRVPDRLAGVFGLRSVGVGVSAGYRFGTTRTLQPGVSAGRPGRARVQLGRGAVLVALGERVALEVDRLGRAAQRGLAAGPARALARDDRAVPAERVDADLGHARSAAVRARSAGCPVRASASARVGALVDVLTPGRS